MLHGGKIKSTPSPRPKTGVRQYFQIRQHLSNLKIHLLNSLTNKQNPAHSFVQTCIAYGALQSSVWPCMVPYGHKGKVGNIQNIGKIRKQRVQAGAELCQAQVKKEVMFEVGVELRVEVEFI